MEATMQVKMICCLLALPLVLACGGGSGESDDTGAKDSGDEGALLDVPLETGIDVVAEEGVVVPDLVDVKETFDPGKDEALDDGLADPGDLQDPGQELPPQPCVENEDCEQGPDFTKAWNCSGYFCHQPTGQCVLADFPDGTPCKPRSECEKPEGVCKAGECVGDAVVCDDGNVCTDDSCDKDLGCLFVDNQAPCDDGTDCTLVDNCLNGECMGSDNQCDCQEDADCLPLEDGDLCNGVLVCDANFCSVNALSIIQCIGRSSDPCKSIECQPATGSCVESPVTNGTSCDDKDPCTLDDVCFDGACAGPVDLVCDDQNPCSDEECVSSEGGCVFTANEADCDDGNECTQGDVCLAFQCVGKATIDCGCEADEDCDEFEDGNACNGTLVCLLDQCVVDPATLVFCDTVDDTDCLESVCDPADGTCGQVAIAENEPCDDGDVCTLESLCQGGQCQAQGPMMICDDLNICNGLEICNPMAGCVAGTPLVCDDQDACTGVESCDGATGCQPGTPPVCDDNDLCNGAETCDAALGCVAGTPLICNDKDACNGLETCDGAMGCQQGTPPVCSDNDVCNGVEACDSLTGCQPGTPLDCVDGTECTADLCDMVTGCSNPNSNEGETCTLATGQDGVCIQGECVLGCQSDNECDDGVGCTLDSCNDLFAECVFETVDELCDDGDLCTGQASCDPVAGCVAGTPLDCSDGDACNGLEVCVTGDGCSDGIPPVCDDGDVCNGQETCDADDGCLPGNGLACDDNDACNGVETCDPVEGCQAGVAPDCSDENPCTDTYCNPVSGCVVESANEGDPCQTVAGEWGQCVSGGCSTDCQGDGDCDDGVPCTEDTCDLVEEMCLFAAVDADCDDGDVCNGKETCDVATGCVAGTAPICDDGDPCNGTETCHPVDGCLAGEPLVCDDADACNGLETCVQNLGCQDGTPPTCDDGDACNGDEICDPAVGCMAGTPLSCDDSDACNGVETCDSLAGCMAGNPLQCDDEDLCTGTETCDSAVGCVAGTPLPCDDSNACNGVETCDPVTGCVDGTALTCDDNDLCTGTETCDPAVGCMDGTPLACDDSDACNGVETCDPVTGCVDGTPLTCDDNDVCTGIETCEAATGCVSGTPVDCSDGDACNGLETCDPANGCQDALPLVCDDENVCTGTEICDPAVGCMAGTPLVCDDNNVCNGQETCDSTDGCAGGTPLICDDSDPCNGLETCEAATGCVSGTPVDCSDGDACNGLETCDPANGCQDALPLVCDDENVCNGTETCDPALGCVAGVTLDCQDDDACNGAEICDPTDGCGPGFPLFCDDYDLCNGTETCEAALGCVSGTPLDCSDGNACNGEETCNANQGCLAGTPLVCDDQDPCNGTETCDPAVGCMAGEPQVCPDDGDKCNGDEVCDPIQGCISRFPLTCDDDDKCNGLETCDPAVGCVAGIPLQCDDSNQCNGVETCDALAGCVIGTPPDCDDGDQCNGLEECDPVEGCVAGLPMTCSDGEQCNGVETCDSVLGCVPGPPLDCSDQDACNGTEECVIGGQGCTAGIPLQCDDSDPCNGLETCDAVEGCQAGTPLVCDDNDACNGVEQCFPIQGCVDGTPPICDDQDPCNGLETCDPAAGCQPGTITVCEGKECGDDGCGGSCGECADGQVCNTNFVCEQVGDDCVNPEQITVVPYIVNGSTVTAANDYFIGGSDCPGVTTPAGGGSPDRVYSFMPTATGDFDIILNPDFDSVLYVISDCESISGNCFGADNQPGTGQETVTLQMIEGQTYYFVVDGSSDISPESGSYVLTLQDACTPQCQGKDCGDDGCGGTCGDCPAGTVCNPDQVCEAMMCLFVLDCLDTCEGDPDCTENCQNAGSEGTWNRVQDLLNCVETECGPDPTPTCQENAITGACATEYQACEDDDGCIPDCTGKLCGDDGCGDSCGECGAGDVCGPQFGCLLDGSTCDVAFVVESLPFSDVRDTSPATADLFFGDDTCPFQALGRGLGSPDIVYQYTPVASGNIVIDLVPGSGFDTALYVYTDDCENVTPTSCEAAADAPGDGTAEQIVVPLESGTTYYIVVDGYSNSTPAAGTYGLDIAEVPGYGCTEMIDLCLRDCLGEPGCLDFCPNLGTLVSGETYGDLMACVFGVPLEWSGPCDPTSADPTCLDTELAGSCLDAWVACQNDSGCNPSCMQPDGVSLKECGDDGCGGSCGTCPAGESCDATDNCVLSGDSCEIPIPVDTLPFVHQGDTSAATDDHSFSFGNCPGVTGSRGGTSPDIVHSFTPADTQDYTITLVPDYDAVLYVASNCQNIGSATCLGADDSDDEATEEVILTLTSGVTYYIFVDGGASSGELSGTYTLTVQTQCDPDCTGGKVCGDDGCGGSCGDCPQGSVCSVSQLCDPYLCGDVWDCLFQCEGEPVCSDPCDDAALASSKLLLESLDLCLEICYEDPDPPTCIGQALTGTCAVEYQACLDDSGCTPDCTDKACGDDGCGGSCGECGTDQYCGTQGACLPEGDRCDHAIAVEQLPFTHTGDTTGAGADYSFGTSSCPGENGARGSASSDIVYSFIPAGDGDYVIGLDAAFDSTLYVVGDCQDIFNSCVAGLDGPAGTPEELTLALTGSTTYYVIVDGFSNSTNVAGGYTLSIATEGDNCDAPITYASVPFQHAGDTSYMTSDYSAVASVCPGMDTTQGMLSPDEVIRFSPSQTEAYDLTLDAQYSASMYVVTNCDDVGTSCLGAVEDTTDDPSKLTLDLTSGTTYYVIVDGMGEGGGQQGAFTLSVDTACAPDCTGGKICGDDGCGGSCGECPQGTWCSGSTSCVPTTCTDLVECVRGCPVLSTCFDLCDDTALPSTASLYWEVINCVVVECGADPDLTCFDGAVAGACSTQGDACTADEGCVPDCADRECGDDGCQGSCGTCDIEGMVCDPGGICVPEGQDCDVPIPITVPASVTGYTFGGSNTYAFATGECPGETGGYGSNSEDRVYSFSPATSGSFQVTLTPDNFDSVVYVVTDCADVTNTCLGAAEETGVAAEQLTLSLTSGTTYYVIVDGASDGADAGSYTLAVDPAVE